jgi:hypothetical protein
MRKQFLHSLVSVLAAIVLFSCHKDPVVIQQQSIQSQKLLGGEDDESIQTILTTADGGHLLTGTTSSSNSGDVRANHSGSTDWWIIRLNSNNDTLWTRMLGGNGNEDNGAAVATNDGGFVVVGSTNSHHTGDVRTNHSPGHFDSWIVKLTASGDTAWTRVLGGSQNDYAYEATITSDGNIVVAGKTTSNNGDVSGSHGGADDFWIVKLNSTNGQLIWQKALGGSGHEEARTITSTTDGGVVIAGTSWSDDGDVASIIGQYDAWIVKLDAGGNLVWKKSIGGTDSDWVRDICNTNDGGYIIAGFTYSDNNGDVGHNHGENDGWVIKLNANGTIAWTTTLGGDTYDALYAVVALPNGSYLLGGVTESHNNGDVGANKGDADGWLLKLDASGQKVWTRNIGGLGYDEITALCINTDGSYTLAGSSGSSNSGDVSGSNHGDGTTGDAWVVKFR